LRDQRGQPYRESGLVHEPNTGQSSVNPDGEVFANWSHLILDVTLLLLSLNSRLFELNSTQQLFRFVTKADIVNYSKHLLSDQHLTNGLQAHTQGTSLHTSRIYHRTGLEAFLEGHEAHHGCMNLLWIYR
jgi:hypothetical protein